MKTFELNNGDGLKSTFVIKSIERTCIGIVGYADDDKWVIDIFTSNSWGAGVYETKEECELAFKELNNLINDEL